MPGTLSKTRAQNGATGLAVAAGLLSLTTVLFLRYNKRRKDASPMVTDDWSQSDRIYQLMPRWRLQASILARRLRGLIGGGSELDPTTGLSRSYWSLKTDAFEICAPYDALEHIRFNFDVSAWERGIASLQEKAASSVAQGDLRAAIRANLCAGASSSLVSSSNQVRFPVDGNQAYDWRIRLIRQAQHRVLFSIAYVSVDADGRTLIEELASAARRGVETIVCLDNFGADAFTWSGPDPRYRNADASGASPSVGGYHDMVQLLISAGVQVCFWRAKDCLRDPACKGEGFKIYDAKNHTKLLIVDGEVAIVGDRNIGKCYFRNPNYSSTEGALTGPCVEALEEQFFELWRAGGGASARREEHLATTNGTNGTAATENGGKQPAAQSALFSSLRDHLEEDATQLASHVWAAVLVSTPSTMATGEDPILVALLSAVRCAERSIDLEFAYMELCRPLRDVLLEAIRRGVTVRLLTNSRETNDLFWINTASLQSILPVVQAGGKLVMPIITPEHKGHVHAKRAIIDERFLLLGSWNAWIRSHVYEAELNVLLDDSRLAKLSKAAIDELEASPCYKPWTVNEIKAAIEADPHGLDPMSALFI